jgi:hypothetical protein
VVVGVGYDFPVVAWEDKLKSSFDATSPLTSTSAGEEANALEILTKCLFALVEDLDRSEEKNHVLRADLVSYCGLADWLHH